jgi:hypothetical protein
VQQTVTDHRDRTDGSSAPPQFMAALQAANAVRLARVARKRRLSTASCARAARRIAAGWLADIPAELHTIRVDEFLLACRGVGDTVLELMLAAAGLNGSERLGDGTPSYGALTPRQHRGSDRCAAERHGSAAGVGRCAAADGGVMIRRARRVVARLREIVEYRAEAESIAEDHAAQAAVAGEPLVQVAVEA